MSFNQLRSDRSELQYRKSGRSFTFNQQRSSSGVPGKGGGGGIAPSSSSSSSLPSNTSFKKSNKDQAAQSKPSLQPSIKFADSAASSTALNVQNGAKEQTMQPVSVLPAGCFASRTTETPNPHRDIPKCIEPVPIVQSSISCTMNSATATATAMPLTKTHMETPKPFMLQFGSLSPVSMSGMQIPARTSSAPPNLDEQKQDLARLDSHNSVPSQNLKLSHKVPVEDSSAGGAHGGGIQEEKLVPKRKVEESQAQASRPPIPAQKPTSLPVPVVSMQIPFQQPQMSMQFGSPNSQIQTQIVGETSLQMPIPMPLSMGSAAQMPQPLFVQGLQPHIHGIPPHGIMHQAQGLNYAPQMPAHLLPQMGANLGVRMTPQYPQQAQGGKVNVPRKATIKITDPKTHEELRLDKQIESFPDGGQSALRPQSRAIPSFVPPSHPLSFYPNSYSTGNLFFPAPNSLPLTTGQMMPLTQPSRYSYPVNQGSQNMPFLTPSFNPLQPSRPAISSLDHTRDILNSTFSGPPRSVPVTVKPPSSSNAEKLVKPLLPHENCSSQLKHGSGSLAFKPIHVAASTVDHASESPTAKSVKVVVEQAVPSTVDHALPALPSIRHEEQVPPVLTAGQVNPQMTGTKGSAFPQPTVDDHASFVERVSSSLEMKAASLPPVEDECAAEPASELELTMSDPTLAASCSDVEKPNGISSEICGSSDVQNGGHDDGADDLSASEQVKCSRQEATEAEWKSGFREVPDGCNADGPAIVSSEEFNPQSDEPDSTDMASESQMAAESDGAKTALSKFGTCSEELDQMPDSMIVSEPGSPESDAYSNREKSSAPVFASAVESDVADRSAQLEEEDSGSIGGDAGVLPCVSKEKHVEFAKPKGKLRKKNKELKEITQKADAAGTNSDDCLAYKAPIEKKVAAESISDPSAPKEVAEDGDAARNIVDDAVLAGSDSARKETQAASKMEPDDWEDAAEVSAPKEAGVSENGIYVNMVDTTKRYSRDFLMKFSEKCVELPDGFELTYDVAGALVSVTAPHRYDRDAYHHGRVSDRSGAGSRADHRRGNVAGDEDRRSRPHGPYVPGKDLLSDAGYGGSAGFRPGQGRNPRSQISMQHSGGILSVPPAHPMSTNPPSGANPRTNADADRWQRASSFQLKGLIPPPQPSLPAAIHKAEKKYEVGHVADVEEAKKRQLKSILNKLTPQNFEKLFDQVKSVRIDNTMTLTGVISQIFDKALMEPTFCEMYADFCFHLDGELPDFVEDNEKITFKKLLLNKCQAEFEKGEREQEEANKCDDEDKVSQSDEEREEKRAKARRRMFGNIRLIGELYKKGMLTERIMHGCINTFLGQYQNPDEENIEALCKLMSTIGEMFDNSRAKVHMDAYFQRMAALSADTKLSSRVRFMLKDAIDLRKNKWQQRRKVEGPKKIEDVHRDAVQERQQAASRVSRGVGVGSYSARKTSTDFGPKGSTLPPSNHAHNGGFRSFASQPRGFATQDVRAEERQVFEARTLSVPLLPRQLGDDSIMLGPQGGLARGMSSRGSSTAAGAHLADVSSSPGEARRTAAALNGFGCVSERSTPGSRADHIPRCAPEKNAVLAPYDHASNASSGDGNSDRAAVLHPTQSPEPTSGNVGRENVQSEEHLRKLSMEAIKEFYSARDEKEVALCIRDLNCPSFHPSVVSLWVTDSFERKAAERDLLAKLLVNLTGSKQDAFSQTHLVEGFEAVLTALEDAVNDAPRAAEFLGHIFGSVVLENIVPLGEVGRLLHDGGEEPGRLRQIGLAGDVLGSTLETIRTKRGQGSLNDVLLTSHLILEDFLPRNPTISKILQRFL